MSNKSELKGRGVQDEMVTPNELFGALIPGLQELLRTPMDGQVAIIITRNWKYVITLAQQATRTRQAYLVDNDLCELEPDGKTPKMEKLEGTQEEVPVYRDREAKERFMKWDADFMNVQKLALPVYKLHVDKLSGIQSVTPVTLGMVEKLLFDPEEETPVAAPAMEVVQS